MTDFRPIFHVDVYEKPDAAVIVHMLKITQRTQAGAHRDEYFALDSNDLALMHQIIERAMAKEKTLRAMVKDSGVVILDPKINVLRRIKICRQLPQQRGNAKQTR